MAKASIKINDEFIFHFLKKTAGSVADIRTIPNYVKNHFINNFQRVQLLDQSIMKKMYIFPKPRPDLNVDPFYMLGVELYFSGKRLGSILYCPDYADNSSLSVDLIDENHDEDEEFYYLKFKISAELFWDFKPNHFKNYKTHVENKESTWEESKLDLRISFGGDYLYSNALKYDEKGEYLPTEAEGENNLKFILNITGNVASVTKNYPPEKEYEKKLKVWELLSQKNITFEGDYLKHFNNL